MDVLSLRGYPLGHVDPWVGGLFGAPRYHYPQATKMTVVNTVSIAIFEPSFLNRHLLDLKAGELPGELTYLHRDAPL